MAYSRVNYLKRIIKIQETYLHHQANGATNEWIYWNVIWPTYFISRSTFYNYMAVNARKQLKELESKEKNNGNTTE